mmetsp:Transcript_26240/g.36981  ORF Transcript_26240/g.36981 Transcript_26240/m.36981 type:complete len:264 (-) Transcript_26240:1948-2739(-)
MVIQTFVFCFSLMSWIGKNLKVRGELFLTKKQQDFLLFYSATDSPAATTSPSTFVNPKENNEEELDVCSALALDRVFDVRSSVEFESVSVVFESVKVVSESVREEKEVGGGADETVGKFVVGAFVGSGDCRIWGASVGASLNDQSLRLDFCLLSVGLDGGGRVGGAVVGDSVGRFVGDRDGNLVGSGVGRCVTGGSVCIFQVTFGDSVGLSVGDAVGTFVGRFVGIGVGFRVSVGRGVGLSVPCNGTPNPCPSLHDWLHWPVW